jgi:alginate O-acetyltransferase complex protein AlgJ
LPDNYAFKKCSEERRKQFWRENAASKVPFFDLRGPMEVAAHAAGHSMYLKLNTHWNMTGAAVWAKSVLGALDQKLIEGMTIPEVDKGAPSSDSPFVAGPVVDVLGDLTVMLGTPRKEPMHDIAVRRKGVTLSSNGVALPGNVPPQIQAGAVGAAAKPTKIEGSTTAAPLYPGHTLFLGDSFYTIFGGVMFAPFMSELTSVHVLADPVSFTQNIIDSDTVVLEVVERSLSSGGVPLIQPAPLAELEKTLAAHHR